MVNATNQFGSVVKTIRIKIGENVSYMKPLHKEYWNEFTNQSEVLVGDDIIYECSIPIYDSPSRGSVMWKINNTIENFHPKDEIDIKDVSKKYTEATTIRVKNSTLKDGGRYECFLMFIYISSDIVTVMQGHSTKVKDLIKKVGKQRLELECTVTGYPLPNLSWFKSNKEISKESVNVSQTVSWSKNNNYMIISSINIILSDDSSAEIYSCFAENRLGNDTKSIEIERGLVLVFENQLFTFFFL